MDAVLPMHSAVDQLYSNQLLTAATHHGVPTSNNVHAGSSLTSSSSTGTSSSGQISHSLQGSAMSLSSSLSLSSSPSPVASPHAHGASTSHPANHHGHIMPSSSSSTLSTANFADAHINKNSSKYSGSNTFVKLCSSKFSFFGQYQILVQF